MRYRHVYYNLEHGFIHNWLVAGPQAIPGEVEDPAGEDYRQKIFHHFHVSKSGITKTPVERGSVSAGLFQIGDYEGSWNYYACREDHLVERSGSYQTPHFLRSWAYTQLTSKTDLEVLLVLTTYGPADVWVNEECVYHQELFYDQHSASLSFKVFLKKGVNKVLVRFESVAYLACAHAIALQVCQLKNDKATRSAEPFPANESLQISIPSLIPALARRNKFERVAAAIYLTQDVFESHEQIRVRFQDELEYSSSTTLRLMRPSGEIYAEATVDGEAGDQVFLRHPVEIPEGPYRIFMMPLAWEYYEHDLRITREMKLWSLGRSQNSTLPYGTYVERRQETLLTAAERDGLFAQIAKMALNLWTMVDHKALLQIAQSAAPLELLGILGMLYRFGDHAGFPKALLQMLEERIRGFPYKLGEALPTKPDNPEADQIISYANQILAGQRYPEQIFSSSGKTGKGHRENGEKLALDWLHQRASFGFSDWDSPASFAEIFVALSHLADLAEAESVMEMAVVVMDKLFATLAFNSFFGAFGSTHGRTTVSEIKGGLLDPTSGIARLMWGTGIFNHHIAAPISLALAKNYELPSIIANIALAIPDEQWSQERHVVSAEREVNKVTYKTPDGMLCSAQNYYPGQEGQQEHIWQATLGSTATVFVTHPACSSEEDARQPNFWAGNAVLPRVAQWKDALIAVHHLPEKDWMGFTHAYFPTYAFNEYVLRQGWAFARKENGYLALTAANGLTLVRSGQAAYRELRSSGQNNIWLCHLGRTALDGDFATFQEKILALDINFNDDKVLCKTLRGETLAFGWQGPLLCNGKEVPLSGFPHYNHPFGLAEMPCNSMEIRFNEDLLRLDFTGLS
jgi:hypothetical protein